MTKIAKVLEKFKNLSAERQQRILSLLTELIQNEIDSEVKELVIALKEAFKRRAK